MFGTADLMPSFVDLVGIVVILAIVFGPSALPRLGAAVGRRIAKAKGLPLPPGPSGTKGPPATNETSGA